MGKCLVKIGIAFTIIMSTLSIASASTTPTQIIDPNNILEKSDHFLGKRVFEEEYKCGDKVEMAGESCSLEGDQRNCQTETSVTEIVECSKNEVVGVYQDSNGESSKERFTKQEFEEVRGNFLRMLNINIQEGQALKKIRTLLVSDLTSGSETKPVISTITFNTFSFDTKWILGKFRPVMRVGLTFQMSGDSFNASAPFVVEITNDLPGLSQLTEMTIGNQDSWQSKMVVTNFTRNQ